MERPSGEYLKREEPVSTTISDNGRTRPLGLLETLLSYALLRRCTECQGFPERVHKHIGETHAIQALGPEFGSLAPM